MVQRKSAQDIAAEVERLRALLPKVRATNAFGDDHHAAMGAQIAVLEKSMSQDSIYDAYGDEDEADFAQNVLDAALTARDWMMGDLAADEGKPSDEWAELVA